MGTQAFLSRWMHRNALFYLGAGSALTSSLALGLWILLCQARASSFALAPDAHSKGRGASTVVNSQTVRAGARSKAQLWLTNHSDSCIDIASVRVSCPCLTVRLSKQRLEPREKVEAIVWIDLSEEPSFIGGLCPEIELLDSRGRTLIAHQLEINVLPRAAERDELDVLDDGDGLLPNSP